MNCCHCFLWCRGSLQGLKAGMRWRHPNPLDLIDFLFLIASLALLLVFSFFFWDLWEVQMPMKVRKRYKKCLFAMGPIFSTSFFWLWKIPPFFFCKRRSKLSAKRPESWWKFLWFPQAAPSTKVTETFFMGKKTEVKEMVRGRKLEVVLKNLGFFFGKETLTTAFVPSFYLNLAWRNWYFVVNL